MPAVRRTLRHRTTTLLGAAVLGACSATPPGTPPAPVPVDTMFYISARARDDDGRDVARLADSLAYGLVVTVRDGGPDPLEGRLSFRVADSVALSREEFTTRLRARARLLPDSAAFAVLYTHGYGTSLHEAWEHSANSRTRARSPQPWVVFAWPSLGAGVAWPRNGDLVSTAYRRDSATAVASRGAYAEAIGTLREAVGGDGLVVVAHSLGSQLVGEALAADSTVREALVADPLRALAFFAPDVEAARFGDSLVPALRPVTRRLLLYASADDRILAVSGMLNDSPRAGRIDGGTRTPVVREGLESIDMTEGATSDSRLRRTFGTRHALRRQSAALFDLIHLVGHRLAPECREVLGTATRTPTGAWRLTPVRLPPTTAVARCAAPQPMDGSTIATTPRATRASGPSARSVTLRR